MIYGRSIRQLVVVWAVTLGLLALLNYFDVSAPAFHELLIPFYWIFLAVAGILTWRWQRSRTPKDRRGKDRRRISRRDGTDAEPSQAAAPERDEK